MNQELKTKIAQVRVWLTPLQARWSIFWDARSRQERNYLTAGAALLLLLLLYMLLLAPAIAGRARLEQSLPLLREQNAQMRALALEASSLAGKMPAADQHESLEQSLARHSLTAQSVSLMGDFAKVQLNGVAFATLLAWLDDAQHGAHLSVQEASVTAQAVPGIVNATLTLHLKKNE